MAMSGPYYPYEVVPLTQCRGGTEFAVSTAFGLMHCLQSDGRATGGGRETQSYKQPPCEPVRRVAT